VEQAVGIVAGTDDDANNLSIVMTAAQLNPDLFMVARQNKRDNDVIFQAALLDLVMQRSEIIARDILALLTTPLLDQFLRLILAESNEWANEQVSRLSAVTGELVPDVWSFHVNEVDAPALAEALAAGRRVLLGEVQRDPRERDRALECLPLLLLRRNHEALLFPANEVPFELGDELLFSGKGWVMERMKWSLQNHNALRYVQTGEERASGYFWQWVFGKQL
jgi:hypothetical protein